MKKKPEKKKGKGGRKSKWDELEMYEKLPLIEYWARVGFTEKSMCESLGVSETTFNEWKKQYPKFVESLKKGREMTDALVVNQVLKKILGYNVVETEEVQDDTGTVLQIKEKTRHIAGSDTLAIFWLKNRLPDQFKDRIDNTHEHSGEVEFFVSLEDDDD